MIGTNLILLSCNYNALDKMKPALESWAQSAEFMAKANVGSVSLFLADNCSKDGSREYLTEMIKNPDPRFASTKIFLHDVNVGKARAVNDMAKIALEGTKSALLFLVDSDIRAQQPELFALASEIAWATKDKTSCLVCWQTGNSLFRRQFAWTPTKDNTIPPFSYFVPREGYGSGIAGGAMFIWMENWNASGGFRMVGANGKTSIYGGNDGMLMFDVYSKTGKPIMVIRQLEVHHPPEDNSGYQSWKDKVHMQHVAKGGCEETKGYFD